TIPDNYKRSGTGLTGRISLKNDRGDKWWNPGVSAGVDFSGTSGTEFNSKGFAFGLTNALHLTDATQMGLSVDFAPISYNQRAGESRSDKMLSLDANLSHKFSEKYSLLGDVQFISNQSNLTDLYQYTRLVVSAGLGYSI